VCSGWCVVRLASTPSVKVLTKKEFEMLCVKLCGAMVVLRRPRFVAEIFAVYGPG
jgi:hypothetical protein